MKLSELVSRIHEENQEGREQIDIVRSVTQDFIAFARGADLRQIVLGKVNNVINDTAFDTMSGSDKEIVLFRSPSCQLTLGLQSGAPSQLYSSGVSGLLFLLGGPSVRYERYALPAQWHDSIFDAETKVEFIGEDLVHPQTHVEIDGAKQLYWFDFCRPGLALKLLFPIGARLLWSFDRTTLKAIDVEAADADADNLLHTADVLAEFDSMSSIAALQEMSKHPAYYVRWHAIQALAHLSADHGLERLREARNDAHPHIKRAAEAALLQFSA